MSDEKIQPPIEKVVTDGNVGSLKYPDADAQKLAEMGYQQDMVIMLPRSCSATNIGLRSATFPSGLSWVSAFLSPTHGSQSQLR